MAEDRERRDVAPDGEERADSVMGAPPGQDPGFQLHSELGHEAERLATHPRDEVKRLGAELAEGETETTPLIAMSVVGVGAAVVVAVVIGLVVLAIYLS